MKKLLLLLTLLVSGSLVGKADYISLVSEREFSQKCADATSASFDFRLMHQSGNVFTTLPKAYKSSDFSTTTTLTLTKTYTLYWEIAKDADAETFSFTKGSVEGTYKMQVKNDRFSSPYFRQINADGSMKTISSAAFAADVEVRFAYGTNGTIHYDGKELQLIDGKMVFAEPTTDTSKKVYLYIQGGNAGSSNTYSLKLYTTQSGNTTFDGSSITVSNTAASSIYVGTDNSITNKGNIFIVAEGTQPSQDFTIAGGDDTTSPYRASVTMHENAAPGTYKFTGYYMPGSTNAYVQPKTFTVTVKGEIDLVWCYSKYGTLKEITPGDDGYFDVEWNPGNYFFNVAEKEDNGSLVKIAPSQIHLTQPDFTFLDTSTGSNSNVSRGYGFAFTNVNNNSIIGDNVNVEGYPCEVTYTATCDNGATVPDLKLRVSQMKPTFGLASSSKSDIAWNSGEMTINITSPGLKIVFPNQAGCYLSARLEPVFSMSNVAVNGQPDGIYDASKIKAAVVRDGATSSSTTAGEISISGIPCSGLYNLVLKYNAYASSTPYVDPNYESVIPLNIYPTSDGLELNLNVEVTDEDPSGRLIFTGSVIDGIFEGLEEFKDATADGNAYKWVTLSSSQVAGIDGWYKAEATTTEPSEAPMAKAVSAPEGYAYTDAAEHRFMDLYTANRLSLYVAKNGAISPTPVNIELKKILENTVTGIDSIEDNSPVSYRYFDLKGFEINPDMTTPGIYIKKGSDGSAVKITAGSR